MSYANEEAIRYYTEALALIPSDHSNRFELLASRAAVFDLIAQREMQLVDIETMLELAEVSDDDLRRCDALIALAD